MKKISVVLLLLLLLDSCKSFDTSPYRCNVCYGNRGVCTVCHDTGKVKCNSNCVQGYIRTCYKCNRGTEVFLENDVKKTRKCTHCKGNFQRKCPRCDFSGMKVCPQCRGVRKRCERCNGTGIDPSKRTEYKNAYEQYKLDKKAKKHNNQ